MKKLNLHLLYVNGSYDEIIDEIIKFSLTLNAITIRNSDDIKLSVYVEENSLAEILVIEERITINKVGLIKHRDLFDFYNSLTLNINSEHLIVKFDFRDRPFFKLMGSPYEIPVLDSLIQGKVYIPLCSILACQPNWIFSAGSNQKIFVEKIKSNRFSIFFYKVYLLFVIMTYKVILHIKSKSFIANSYSVIARVLERISRILIYRIDFADIGILYENNGGIVLLSYYDFERYTR